MGAGRGRFAGGCGSYTPRSSGPGLSESAGGGGGGRREEAGAAGRWGPVRRRLRLVQALL